MKNHEMAIVIRSGLLGSLIGMGVVYSIFDQAFDLDIFDRSYFDNMGTLASIPKIFVPIAITHGGGIGGGIIGGILGERAMKSLRS